MGKKSITVVNSCGEEVDFEASITYMDEEIREKLHEEISPCTEQEFFNAYCKTHLEKYHAEWFLNVPNPVW